MRWPRFSDMIKDVDVALSDALNLGFLSTGIELQVDSVNTLAALYQAADEFREAAILRGDEEVANKTFLVQRFICGTQNYLRMWVHLKQDQAERGWEALIEAQGEIECGLRFQEQSTFRTLGKHLLVLENVLFPRQVFTSPSVTYRSAVCTICGTQYGECHHVAGRLYMGQMCAARVQEIVGVDHLAIVDHPEDKHCRITKFQRGNSMIDKLTQRVVGEANNSNEGQLKTEAICMRAGRGSQIYTMESIETNGSNESRPIQTP